MATWKTGHATEPALKTVMVNREEYAAFLDLMAAVGWELIPIAGCMGVKRGKRKGVAGRVSLVVTDGVVRLDVARGRRAA